jgi:Ca2+-binding RTX toxin-like protein
VATYQFSALADGQAISFNPNADVLNFDQSSVAAGGIRVTTEGSNLRVTVVSGPQADKDIVLLGTSARQLAMSNVTFADGSRLLFGDNSAGTGADDAANLLTGTAGMDYLVGFGGADTLQGGAGSDTYFVSSGDVVDDTSGWDLVYSDVSWSLAPAFGDGTLTITGTGAISGQGNNSDNVIFGNDAGNVLNGRAGNDAIHGNGGNDTIDMSAGGTSSYGNDSIYGGAGVDTVDFLGTGALGPVEISLGGAGTARVAGNHFQLIDIENAIGGAYDDTMRGGNESNFFFGGAGSDTLIGSAGNDTLEGGTGSDSFDFVTFPAVTGVDRINDFTSASDKLRFDRAAFANIGAEGNFAPGDDRFMAGPGFNSAREGSDRVVYNTTTGQLWYDTDGIGGDGAQLVATLLGNPSLAATDIVVFGQHLNTSGTEGDDSLVGGPGNDMLDGRGGNDTIEGLGGNDSLIGGTGNDQIHGGAGWDTLRGGDGDDHLNGDTLWEDAHGNDSIDGGDGHDVIFGRRGNDTLLGGAGDDHFVMDSSSSDFSSENIGSDFVDGGTGNDWIGFGTEGVSTTRGVNIDLSAGWYVVYETSGPVQGTVLNVENAGGSFFAEIIRGTEGANILGGLNGADTIEGLGGDDTISMEGGHSVLFGGSGNDSINGGSGSDTLFGGAGNDTLNGDYTGGPASVSDSFVFDVAPGTANADLVRSFAPGVDKIVLESSAYNRIGAAGNFAAGDDRFMAGPGFTSGREASDRVVYDTLTGNLYYDADGSGAGAAQRIATLEGAPALQATDIAVTGDGGMGGDFEGTEGNDTITGTLGSDRIDGRGGDDSIDGSEGSDSLIGGTGNDTLSSGFFGNHGDSAADMLDGGLGDDAYHVAGDGDVILSDPGGVDTVFAHNTDWTLGEGLENLDIYDSIGSAFDATGNELDNVISGASEGGTLRGMGGNDTLLLANAFNHSAAFGGDGSDTLHGARNSDLHGEAGDDWLIAGYPSTTMTGGAGADSFVISLSVDITDFASGVDRIRLDANDMPGLGTSGDFAAGDDRFMAGPGFTSAREGSDRVVYDTSSGNLYYDGDGAGGDGAQLIATLHGAPALRANDISVFNSGTNSQQTGTAGNDALVGGEGNDTLNGLAGDDRLDGRQGNDRLEGGEGADRYTFSWGPSGSNADTIVGFVSGSDRIVLSSTDHFNIGMSGDFAAGDDRFMAGAGFSSGQEGSDRVVYDSASGRLYFDADGFGPGAAQLIATLAGAPTLQASDITVEGPNTFGGTAGNDFLPGTEGEDILAGREGNDNLSGGPANDQLYGEAGDDWLDGRQGNDRLEGGAGADRYAFTWGTGAAQADTIVGFASGTDKIMLSASDHPGIGAMGEFAPGDDRFMAGAGFAAGQEGSDRVVYDTSSGNLYYDADGFGAGAAQLIATLQGAPTLAASDIVVI